MEDFEMEMGGEDSYLDTYWEDQFDNIGDHDETNYDPYMGCDSFDYGDGGDEW